MSRNPLRRLLTYARPHRRRALLATAASIFNKIWDLAPPALIGAAVDVVVRREDSALAGLGLETVEAQLWALAGITLVIWALESVFEYLQKWLWRNLAQTIQHELRVDAYDHMQRLDLAFFEQARTGGLMAILNDDVNQLERFLDIGANDLLQVGTTVVVIGAAFFWIAPDVAWLALLPMPFVLWGSFAFQRRIAPRYSVVRERSALVNSQLASNLDGMATVKSYAAEGHELERIGVHSQAYRTANRDAIRLSAAFSPLIRMVIVVGFTATLVLGGLAVTDGDMAVGTYSVMVFLTQRLLWPLTRLGDTFDQLQRAMASTSRIMDLLDTPITIRSGGRRLPKSAVAGELVLEDLDFSYEGRDPLFQGLNLTIGAGETVALVGVTGSGKSTLGKLLLRFYEPTGGRILLDGVPLNEVALEDLRGAIGLVSQEVFLFHGSVADNIRYGTFDADAERVIEAARVAEAHGFVSALPEGYETLVGEHGQRLSGGQRQRISIARAVLKDPPILILDEATSAVDNETEAAIQRSLTRITRDRTTIVVAHRLSTIRHADRILVLDAGRVIESGRHEQLLAHDGAYAALWRVQTGDIGREAA